MSKVFKGIIGLVVAGCAAKVGYDIYCEQQRKQLDEEFLNDLNDDIDLEDDDFFEDENVKATPVKKVAKAADEKTVAKKTTVKKTTAKKSETKKTTTKKADTKKDAAYSVITCQDVIDCTANVLDVTAEDILSKSRKADITEARRVALYLCAEELKADKETILGDFGGLGQSSLTSAKKAVKDKMKADKDFAANVKDVISEMVQLEKSMNV